MESDEYKTLIAPGHGTFRDRGSKFYAFSRRVKDEKDVAMILDELKSEHPKSRHICYAYRLGLEASLYRMNDDGEPPGSAGRPIFDVIRSHELYEVMIAVVRYFGGTKLGVGGLINAYKTAARYSVDNATVDNQYLKVRLRLDFESERIGEMYNYLKQLGVDNIENEFPQLYIEVRKKKVNWLKHCLTAKYHGIHPDNMQDDYLSDRLKIECVV